MSSMQRFAFIYFSNEDVQNYRADGKKQMVVIEPSSVPFPHIDYSFPISRRWEYISHANYHGMDFFS